MYGQTVVCPYINIIIWRAFFRSPIDNATKVLPFFYTTNFLVNDPSSRVNRKDWPANGISGVRLHVGPNSPSVNPAAIVIRVYSPVELLVTDPLGRRIGRDPIVNSAYSEVPRAFYELIGLDDDNDVPDSDPAKEINIREPESGKYSIKAIGTGNGTYDIDVYLFDSTGNRQELNLEKSPIIKDKTQEFTLTYSQSHSPGLMLKVEPSNLWPPNNKLVQVNAVVSVSERSEPPPTVRLTSITCDDNCLPARDIVGADYGTDDRKFQLRATRSGDGSGRTYTITYSVTDSAGIESQASTRVFVPHDQR